MLVNTVSCLWGVLLVGGALGSQEPTTTPPTHSLEHENRISKLVDSLLNRMDPRVRPYVSGPPVPVTIDCHVMTLGAIDAITMDYMADIYFRQKWLDPRLAYNESDYDDSLTLTHGIVSDIWIPDTFFANEKSAETHDVIVPNDQLKIYPNGTIQHSVRLTLKLSCPMDLHYYPLDRQQCYLDIGSFSYENHQLTLEWLEEDPVTLDAHMRLPEMDLIDTFTFKRIKQTKIPGGTFDSLTVEFRMERVFMYHVLQTFIPSVLIVALSWVSFWITMEAVPARVSLGVTAVLTMTAHLSGSKADHPKVSYLKASDVWSSACMVFVFAALLEYAIVNALMRSKRDSYKKKTDSASPDYDQSDAVAKAEVGSTCRCFKLSNRHVAKQVDHVCRILFPVAFIIFNFIYWLYYLLPPPFRKFTDRS